MRLEFSRGFDIMAVRLNRPGTEQTDSGETVSVQLYRKPVSFSIMQERFRVRYSFSNSGLPWLINGGSMKKNVFIVLMLMLCMLSLGLAETAQIEELPITTEYRWFVNQYRNVRTVKVSYYDNVYANNHGTYGLTPFAASVPSEYFVKDQNGVLAVAPIVNDITDAMRIRLFGADIGETALLYGQYCERIRGKKGKIGFSGIHEGIDFVSFKGLPIHTIMDGEVTRAGDRNGTVGVYNEEYDVTLLYLHCQKICVKRGMKVKAGDIIAQEGGKGIYAGYENNVSYARAGIRHVHTSHYTHVEMRYGRHTSSNKYRNTKLESDCPYPVMQKVLGVTPSGREPVTEAAVLEAERLRMEAEAAARAEAAAAAAAAAAAMATPVVTPEPTPEILIVDQLPGAPAQGYGFDPTSSPSPTPVPAAVSQPVVENTLPPTSL